MLLNVILTSFFLILSYQILIESSGFGRCPLYGFVPFFNVSWISGDWYELERTFYAIESGTRCTSIKILVDDKSKIVIISKTFDNWISRCIVKVAFGVALFEEASAYYYSSDLSLPTVLTTLIPTTGVYSILYTDYTNTMILYKCSDFGIAHIDHIWIFGRKREISGKNQKEAHGIIKELNIDPERLFLSLNTNCENCKVTGPICTKLKCYISGF